MRKLRLLLLCALLLPNATFANSLNPFPAILSMLPKWLRPTPRDHCDTLLHTVSAGGNKTAQLQTLMIEWLRRNLGVGELPAELTDIKVIASVGERFIVKQSDGLKLVSLKGLRATEFDVVKLHGSDLDGDPYVQNGLYIIRTKSRINNKDGAFPSDTQYFLNYVHDLIPNALSTYYPYRKELLVAGERGTVTAFGNNLFLTSSHLRSPEPLRLPGRITNAQMETIEGLPVLSVTYKNQYQNTEETRTAYYYVQNLSFSLLVDISSEDKFRAYKMPGNQILLALNRDSNRRKGTPRFELQLVNSEGKLIVENTVHEDIDPRGFTRLSQYNFNNLSLFEISKTNLIMIEGNNIRALKDTDIVEANSQFLITRQKRKRDNNEDTFYKFTVYRTNANADDRQIQPITFESSHPDFKMTTLPPDLSSVEGLYAFGLRDNNKKNQILVYSAHEGKAVLVSSIDSVASVKKTRVRVYTVAATLDGRHGVFTIDNHGHFELLSEDTFEEDEKQRDQGQPKLIVVGQSSALVPSTFNITGATKPLKVSYRGNLDAFEVVYETNPAGSGFSKANVYIKLIETTDRDGKVTEEIAHNILFDPYTVAGSIPNMLFGGQAGNWNKEAAKTNSGAIVFLENGIRSITFPGRATKVVAKADVFPRADAKNLLSITSIPRISGVEEFREAVTITSFGSRSLSNAVTYFNTYEVPTEGMASTAMAFGAEQTGSIFRPEARGVSHVVVINTQGISSMEVAGKITGLHFNHGFYGDRAATTLIEVNTVGVRGNSFRNNLSIATLRGNKFEDQTQIFNPYTVKANGFQESERVYVGEQIGSYDEDTRGKSSIVVFRPESKPITQQVTGTVTDLNISGRFIEGHGYLPLVTSRVPVNFRLNAIDLHVGYELVHGFHIYKDDEIEVQATRRMNDRRPRVIYIEKNQPGTIHEVTLDFALDPAEKARNDAYIQFLKQVFGFEDSGESKYLNDSDIEDVRRDGDLLFIKTFAAKGSVSKTYVYSIAKRKLMFMVPNMTDRPVDVGDFRFYVGQPSSFNRCIVSVFNKQTHAYITHFDFGRVRLDMSRLPHLIEGEGGAATRLRFYTSSGSARVFNEATNGFEGFLPQDIRDMVHPVVEKLGENMNVTMFDTDHAPIIGRDETLRKIEERMPMRANDVGSSRAVLVRGENGSGLTATTREFVARYLEGRLHPAPDINAVFIRVQGLQLQGDTKWAGSFADKFTDLIKLGERLRERGYRLVLIMDDIDQIKDPWRDADTLGKLRSVMESGMVDVIATATPRGIERLTLEKPELISKFQQIELPKKTEDELFNDLKQYIAQRQLDPEMFDDITLRYMISRLQRMANMRALPGAAYELVEAIVTTARDRSRGGQRHRITRLDINEGLAGRTGIPAMLLDPDQVGQVHDDLLAFLDSNVIGQGQATSEIADVTSGFAYDYIRADRPIGTYLFPGPTGVGKTETALALARFLFRSTNPLLKISGEDYPAGMNPEQARKVKENIVAHLRRYPFCIILFDEIEKMDESVRQMLLSLADGMITDEHGNQISSSMAIIIGTSNVGMAQVMKMEDEQNHQLEDVEIEDITATQIRRFFRPEQQGRLRIIHFRRLKKNIMRLVLNNYLTNPAIDNVAGRLLRDNIKIDFSDEAIDYMIHAFFDKDLGARKLADNVERHLVGSFIVRQRRLGRIQPGRSSLALNAYTIGYDKEKNTFTIHQTSASARPN